MLANAHVQSALVGFFAETVTYGIFVILSITLSLKHGWSTLDPVLTGITFVSLLLCTAHLALNIDSVNEGSAWAISTSRQTTIALSSSLIFGLINFIGQISLIRGLWCYRRDFKAVVLPMLLALAALVFGALGLFATLDTAIHGSISNGELAMILALTLHLYCQKLQSSYIDWTILYSAAQVVDAGLYMYGLPARNVFAPIALQIYGMAPLLVLLSRRNKTPSRNDGTLGHDKSGVKGEGAQTATKPPVAERESHFAVFIC